MSRHFASTTATDSHCQRCQGPILTALDEGITARVDARPLPNPAAEVAALLDNRRTFVLTANRLLIYRDASRIAGGKQRGSIHAEHRCSGPTQLSFDDLIGNQ